MVVEYSMTASKLKLIEIVKQWPKQQMRPITTSTATETPAWM